MTPRVQRALHQNAGGVRLKGIAPIALFSAPLVAFALALTARAEAYIYWTNAAGYIHRANLDGSPSVAPREFGDDSLITTQIPETSDGVPVGVDVEGAHIYWANSNTDIGTTIGRANIDGTGLSNSFITGASAPVDVTVNPAHIYWTNPNSDTIGRANLDGSAVDHSFIPREAGGSPGGLALDDKHIYWASRFYAIGRANLNGTGVDQRFITGTHPGPKIPGDDDPCGLAVDATHIYWGNHDPTFESGGGPETIGRANLDGTGKNKTFITGVESPCGVAVDARPGFGKVKRDKKRGTAKLTVVVPGPGELALAKTKKVKGAKRRADAEGRVKLPVKPKGRAKKKLNGRAR